MKKSDVLNLSKFALGLVFLAASWPKLNYPYEFLSNVYSFGLLGPDGGLLVATLLPWVELAVGLALVANIATGGALLLSTGLCLMFVAVQGWALAQGLEISCGCFGDGGTINYSTFLRTAGLLLWSGVTLYFALRVERMASSSSAEAATAPA